MSLKEAISRIPNLDQYSPELNTLFTTPSREQLSDYHFTIGLILEELHCFIEREGEARIPKSFTQEKVTYQNINSLIALPDLGVELQDFFSIKKPGQEKEGSSNLDIDNNQLATILEAYELTAITLNLADADFYGTITNYANSFGKLHPRNFINLITYDEEPIPHIYGHSEKITAIDEKAGVKIFSLIAARARRIQEELKLSTDGKGAIETKSTTDYPDIISVEIDISKSIIELRRSALQVQYALSQGVGSGINSEIKLGNFNPNTIKNFEELLIKVFKVDPSFVAGNVQQAISSLNHATISPQTIKTILLSDLQQISQYPSLSQETKNLLSKQIALVKQIQ